MIVIAWVCLWLFTAMGGFWAGWQLGKLRRRETSERKWLYELDRANAAESRVRMLESRIVGYLNEIAVLRKRLAFLDGSLDAYRSDCSPSVSPSASPSDDGGLPDYMPGDDPVVVNYILSRPDSLWSLDGCPAISERLSMPATSSNMAAAIATLDIVRVTFHDDPGQSPMLALWQRGGAQGDTMLLYQHTLSDLTGASDAPS
ncbi:MAG: hypothetical protein WC485_04830 [Opitutaceae bacterium]